jgi:predicted Fe-Mo cluster-binding NifX family protein
MKKVAIATSGNMISNHFGHCEYFIVYDIDGKTITGSTIIKNPPHQKGYLPNYLKQEGVDVLITGNIGEMAVKMLEDLGIEVYRGINDQATEVIAHYLEGTLVSSDVICREHMNHHD